MGKAKSKRGHCNNLGFHAIQAAVIETPRWHQLFLILLAAGSPGPRCQHLVEVKSLHLSVVASGIGEHGQEAD